jgi:membrane-associated phospholipid phosphatase
MATDGRVSRRDPAPAPRRSEDRRDSQQSTAPSRVSGPVLIALSCASALAMTGLLAFGWSPMRSIDAESLAGFIRLSIQHPRLAHAADWTASGATLPTYAAAGAILAAVALIRRRRRLAIAIPFTLAAADATAELLKYLVVQPRHSHLLAAGDQVSPSSWPSGHAAAATTLALCAVVVVPRALRPLAALVAAAGSIGVAYIVLMLGWHFPSDVVGGILVAGAWVWVMLAVVSWSEGARPSVASGAAAGRLTMLTPVALVAIGLCALALCWGLVAMDASLGASMLAAMVLIALLVASLTTGLVAALRALGPPRGRAPLA